MTFAPLLLLLSLAANVPAPAPKPDGGAPNAQENCAEPPACNLAPPEPGPETPWRHASNASLADRDDARHRGYDLLLREGDSQWAIAKFAYHAFDKDVEDEDVEVFVLRDCTRWEKLGETRTTDGEHRHPTEAGVTDSGGRVYFEIPASKRLGIGLHRLEFVMKADHSAADAYIQVLPRDAHAAVSDVDGTLTETEGAAIVPALVGGETPRTHPGAPEALSTLARKGYAIVYLSARPEWMAQATHRWLAERGFPRGIVRVTQRLTGVVGKDAQAFKAGELASLTRTLGHPFDFALGNMPSDVAAYASAKIDPQHSYYFHLEGNPGGGNVIESYQPLAVRFRQLRPQCR